DLRADGVTVRPIDQLDGLPGFAELFLEDVFVPDDPANPAESGVIGAVDKGWRVAMSTANNERGLSLRSPGRFLATTDRLLETWRRSGPTLVERRQAALAGRVVDGRSGTGAYELRTWPTRSKLTGGADLGLDPTLSKVFWSDRDTATHETALDGLRTSGEVAGEKWMD